MLAGSRSVSSTTLCARAGLCTCLLFSKGRKIPNLSVLLKGEKAAVFLAVFSSISDTNPMDAALGLAF